MYRHPAFQGAGWDGPTVLVSFADSAPLATIYGFYARRAAAAGWRPTGRNGLGFTHAMGEDLSGRGGGETRAPAGEPGPARVETSLSTRRLHDALELVILGSDELSAGATTSSSEFLEAGFARR